MKKEQRFMAPDIASRCPVQQAIPAMQNHETWTTFLINNKQTQMRTGCAPNDSADGQLLKTATSNC